MSPRTIRLPAVREDALFSLTAEQAILHGLAACGAEFAAALAGAGFNDADFHRGNHREVYRLLLRHVKKAGEGPLDMAAVLDEALSLGLHRSGDARLISGLGSVSAPNGYSSALWAGRVQDYAHRRRILTELREAIISLSAAAAPEEVVEKLTRALAKTCRQTRTGDLKTGQTLADAGARSLNDPQRAPRMSTGIAPLDEVLSGGTKRGKLYIVAGRPKHGKSALVLNVVRNRCAGSIRCHVDSLEMSATETVERPDGSTVVVHGDLSRRLLALESGVAMGLVDARSTRHHPERGPAVQRANLTISDWPLTVNDDARRTIGQITAGWRRLKAAYPDLTTVVLDYAGLVTGAPGQERRLLMGEVSRECKLTADELGLDCWLLAQINRGPESRSDQRPRASDLKESGDLEQDADAVILVQNPKVAGRCEDDVALWVCADIHRHGPSGLAAWCEWDGETQRIGGHTEDPTLSVPTSSATAWRKR